jgi:hypothetical protein
MNIVYSMYVHAMYLYVNVYIMHIHVYTMYVHYLRIHSMKVVFWHIKWIMRCKAGSLFSNVCRLSKQDSS